MNAMAASLAPDDLGSLVDPHGGRVDLEQGSGSRASRRVVRRRPDADLARHHATRRGTGFRFDEHTEALARACIESGHVGDLSSSRLRDELVALLDDDGAPDGIRRLGELGVDAAIHPRLRGDGEAAALFARATALRDELALDVPSWRLGLAALARAMTADEASDWLDRLKVGRRHADLIAGAVVVAPRIVERLGSEPLDPAQVVALADPFAPDAPLAALALDDRRELRETGTGCGTCVSRSTVPTSSRWAYTNRRRSVIFPPRSWRGSSTASWTGAKAELAEHASSLQRDAP